MGSFYNERISYISFLNNTFSQYFHDDQVNNFFPVIPHITDAIQEWVQRVAHIPVTSENTPPRVCIVELGGTIGDIEGMSFVEAFRQFQFRVKRENFCCAHVSLVPMVSVLFVVINWFCFGLFSCGS